MKRTNSHESFFGRNLFLSLCFFFFLLLLYWNFQYWKQKKLKILTATSVCKFQCVYRLRCFNRWNGFWRKQISALSLALVPKSAENLFAIVLRLAFFFCNFWLAIFMEFMLNVMMLHNATIYFLQMITITKQIKKNILSKTRNNVRRH